MSSTLSEPHDQKNALLDTQSEQDITSKNQLTSPFLKLPSEIRNMIYTKAFRSSTTVVRSHHDEIDLSELWNYSQSAAALILVSRQVRFEALPLFYPLATFDIGFCNSTRAAKEIIGVENSAKITSLIESINTLFGDSHDEVCGLFTPFPNVKPSGEMSVWEEALMDAEEQALMDAQERAMNGM